jgi:hypothetical protein
VLWARVGLAVGSVTSALLPLKHPAAQREFVWDLRHCWKVIELRSKDVTVERRPLLQRIVERYRKLLSPLLPRLRTSVVHNDPNDYNIVVDGAGRVGVLDFGDMVHTYTCADAAICMAYLLFHCSAGTALVESIVPFVGSFHKSCPLLEEELEALFGLAVMRVCTSVCMSAYQSRLEPGNEYLLISAKPAWALLERLEKEDTAKAPAAFRMACSKAEDGASLVPRGAGAIERSKSFDEVLPETEASTAALRGELLPDADSLPGVMREEQVVKIPSKTSSGLRESCLPEEPESAEPGHATGSGAGRTDATPSCALL